MIVTDRDELDEQIAGTFSACGALTKVLDDVQAQSREHLKELLRGQRAIPFHADPEIRRRRAARPFPVLSNRRDIIVITDEAHR